MSKPLPNAKNNTANNPGFINADKLRGKPDQNPNVLKQHEKDLARLEQLHQRLFKK
jgi:hypothetical protein